jgi:hypothetical protein
MRVMVLIKATSESEAGGVPSSGLLAEMARFNEKLLIAGVLLAADGLQPSSAGVRVRFDGPSRSVIDGPFTETTAIVSGYWIWQVRSLDEAIEWLKRAPFGGGTEVEIRPVVEADEFGEAFRPELRARGAHVAEKAAALQGGNR